MENNTEVKPHLTDEEIISLYWSRNEQAIPETDKVYRGYLMRVASNVLSDEWDCEECLNDTYADTWNRIPPTRPGIFRAFLSKITRNVAVDKYRKRRSAKRIPSELTVSLDEFAECLCDTADSQREESERIADVLNDFLGDLGVKERFIFVCRYYYSDSVSYIAGMLNISPKQIYRRLSELRAELRQKLEEEDITV